MASPSKRFLVVDDNPDGRALLARTLRRKFPQAEVLEFDDAARAAEAAKKESLSALLVHRAGECNLAALVQLMREANPDVPILALSGVDRRAEALRAGANHFLFFDQWLMAGNVVEGLLRSPGPG